MPDPSMSQLRYSFNCCHPKRQSVAFCVTSIVGLDHLRALATCVPGRAAFSETTRRAYSQSRVGTWPFSDGRPGITAFPGSGGRRLLGLRGRRSPSLRVLYSARQNGSASESDRMMRLSGLGTCRSSLVAAEGLFYGIFISPPRTRTTCGWARTDPRDRVVVCVTVPW